MRPPMWAINPSQLHASTTISSIRVMMSFDMLLPLLNVQLVDALSQALIPLGKVYLQRSLRAITKPGAQLAQSFEASIDS